MVPQEVIISCPGMSDKQFIANRWLSTEEGDGQTYVVLYPATSPMPPPHKYRIHVSRGPALVLIGSYW